MNNFKLRIKNAILRYLALLGSSPAQNYMGYIYEEGILVTKNIALAKKWYTLAAKQEDMHGLANLAALYEKGEGVEKDIKHSMTLYEQAALKGHLWSQIHLANILIKKNSIVDKKQAIYWFREASEKHNDGYAKLNLAWLYSEGIAIQKDVNKAYELTREAAIDGVPEAQYNLGIMLLSGEGTGINHREGMEWIQKAKQSGVVQAKDFLEER